MMTDDGKIGVRSNLLQLWVVFWLLLLMPCSAFAATTYDFANLGTASGGFKPQGNRFLVSEAFRNDSLFDYAMFYGSAEQTVSGMTIKTDGVNLFSFDLNDIKFMASPGPLTIPSLKITATRSIGEPVSVTVLSRTLAGTGSSFKLSDLGINLSAFTNVSQLQFDVTVEADKTVMYLDFASIEISNEVHSPPTISTSFSASYIPVGDSTPLTFTLSNSNTSATLQGISFNDTLPDGLIVASPTNLSSTCGGTVTAVPGSSTVSLSDASLAPTASCTVAVNVTGTTAGEKLNSVTVNSANGGTGNSASASLTVGPADLEISTTSDSASAPPQSNLTYTITFKNNGPTAAKNVSITSTLPATTTYKALSMGGEGSDWAMSTPSTGSSGTVTCTKASISSGESAVFLLTVQINADVANDSVISNTSTVSALTPDPNPANNASTASSTVIYPVRTKIPEEYYPTISAALSGASSPNTIEALGISLPGNLTLAQNKVVSLKGGYDSIFYSNNGITTISAPLTVVNGTLTLERVAVK